jgi:hypothetical protein
MQKDRKGNEYAPKRKRGRQINVYLNDEEFQTLEYKADLTGFSKSDYLRAAIFINNITVQDRHWKGDMQKLVYEMNRIGNNINQIALRCNERGTADQADVIEIAEQYNELFLLYEKNVLGLKEL